MALGRRFTGGSPTFRENQGIYNRVPTGQNTLPQQDNRNRGGVPTQPNTPAPLSNVYNPGVIAQPYYNANAGPTTAGTAGDVANSAAVMNAPQGQNFMQQNTGQTPPGYLQQFSQSQWDAMPQSLKDFLMRTRAPEFQNGAPGQSNQAINSWNPWGGAGAMSTADWAAAHPSTLDAVNAGGGSAPNNPATPTGTGTPTTADNSRGITPQAPWQQPGSGGGNTPIGTTPVYPTNNTLPAVYGAQSDNKGMGNMSTGFLGRAYNKPYNFTGGTQPQMYTGGSMASTFNGGKGMQQGGPQRTYDYTTYTGQGG